MLYVNIYSVGRGYGGPEEGGWWYDTGTPIAAIPVTLTDDETNIIIQMQGFTAEQVEAYRQDHVRYGDPEWLNIDHDAYAAEYAKWLRVKAEETARVWREQYPETGRRSSVLGGEDYDIRIETEFPKPYPAMVPHYE